MEENSVIKQPFFTIITPTLQRESLKIACSTLDSQTFKDWTHIVVIDCDDWNWPLLDQISRQRRGFMRCEKPHKNGGNTCRHIAWTFASGRYIYYLDDDNYMADATALQRMHDALVEADFPLVAFFPIHRLGGRFFPDGKPRICHVDTGNLVVVREIGQWPDTDAYCSDGLFIEDLLKEHEYKSFPEQAPIMVLPTISFGR